MDETSLKSTLLSTEIQIKKPSNPGEIYPRIIQKKQMNKIGNQIEIYKIPSQSKIYKIFKIYVGLEEEEKQCPLKCQGRVKKVKTRKQFH